MLEMLMYAVHFPTGIKIPNIVVVKNDFIWIRAKLKHVTKTLTKAILIQM